MRHGGAVRLLKAVLTIGRAWACLGSAVLMVPAFTRAADPPLVPVTVCDVVRDLSSYDGKEVAVVGRYSFRENGRWLSEQACETGKEGSQAVPAPMLWLTEDGNDGPRPSGDFAIDSVALDRKFTELRRRTSLGKFRFGAPDYDRWALVYGKVELRKNQSAPPAAGRKNEPAERGPAPADLVFRGSGVVLFLTVDR